MNKENNKCPICQSLLVCENRKVSANYKNHKILFEQPGEWCNACDEGFLSPSDLLVSKKNRTDQIRIIEHKLQSKDIVQFRKTNKLSQKKAGELLGGGPRAFSKYERGEVIQTKSLDILIRLINAKKISIQDIEEIEMLS